MGEEEEEKEELVVVRICGDLRIGIGFWERNREQCGLVGVRAWSVRSRADSVVGEDRRSSGLGSRALLVEFSCRSHFQERGIAEMARLD